jgi:hypothetical protein
MQPSPVFTFRNVPGTQVPPAHTFVNGRGCDRPQPSPSETCEGRTPARPHLRRQVEDAASPVLHVPKPGAAARPASHGFVDRSDTQPSPPFRFRDRPGRQGTSSFTFLEGSDLYSRGPTISETGQRRSSRKSSPSETGRGLLSPRSSPSQTGRGRNPDDFSRSWRRGSATVPGFHVPKQSGDACPATPRILKRVANASTPAPRFRRTVRAGFSAAP